MTTWTALIPEAAEHKFTRTVNRLARRAGATVVKVSGTTTLIKPADEWSKAVALPCARYTLDVPEVFIGGWRLLCRIEHTAAGNLVTCPPGETEPKGSRDREPLCDHCGTQRRRGSTWLLADSDGHVKQVGHNCLADFLHESPDSLAARAELAAAMGDFYPPGASFDVRATIKKHAERNGRAQTIVNRAILTRVTRSMS